MYCTATLKSRGVRLIALLLLIGLIAGVPAAKTQRSKPKKLTTPEGVRLLKNKSFDDSEKARKEIRSTRHKTRRDCDSRIAPPAKNSLHFSPRIGYNGRTYGCRKITTIIEGAIAHETFHCVIDRGSVRYDRRCCSRGLDCEGTGFQRDHLRQTQALLLRPLLHGHK